MASSGQKPSLSKAWKVIPDSEFDGSLLMKCLVWWVPESRLAGIRPQHIFSSSGFSPTTLVHVWVCNCFYHAAYRLPSTVGLHFHCQTEFPSPKSVGRSRIFRRDQLQGRSLHPRNGRPRPSISIFTPESTYSFSLEVAYIR